MPTIYAYLPPACGFYVVEEEEPYIVQTSRGPISVPPLPPVDAMSTTDRVRHWLCQRLKQNATLADTLAEAPDFGLLIRVIARAVDDGVLELPEIEES